MWRHQGSPVPELPVPPADINECQRYPGRLCGHKCENTPGSYLCSCSAGFRLSVDGRSCEGEGPCPPRSQQVGGFVGAQLLTLGVRGLGRRLGACDLKLSDPIIRGSGDSALRLSKVHGGSDG